MTILTTDLSQYGIGAVLSLQDEDGIRRMIPCGDRTKICGYGEISARSRMGSGKFNHYISGAPILVEIDRKPLVSFLECKKI